MPRPAEQAPVPPRWPGANGSALSKAPRLSISSRWLPTPAASQQRAVVFALLSQPGFITYITMSCAVDGGKVRREHERERETWGGAGVDLANGADPWRPLLK